MLGQAIMFSEFRFALRTFRRTPALVGAAVLATALGVGANTAIFSVMQAVLLRPLPYRDPARVVLVWEKNPVFGGFLAERLPVARRNFAEWKLQATSFTDLEAVDVRRMDLTGGDRPEEVQVAEVTPGFLALLGRTPQLGRSFAADEGVAGKDQVTLLSYGLWQRRFGKDPQVLGRGLTVGGKNYDVVGVLPADFHLPATFQGMEQNRPDLWLPTSGQPNGSDEDFGRRYYVFGRLRDGVTVERARAEMVTIAKRLQEKYANEDKGFSASVWPLKVEDVSPETRRTVIALQVAVGFVLLIACANVANLLLARAAGRGREMAIRAAMGASRGRLVRQALSESLLLSGAGGAIGVFLAHGAMRGINALAPQDNYHFHEIGLDWTVLVFAAAIAALSGIFFGLAPAFVAGMGNLRDTLAQDGRAGVGLRSKRLRSALVVAEVAAALILLAGAGLMLRSMAAVLHVSPGFDPSHVLTAHIRLPLYRYPQPEQRRTFNNELLDRLSKIGGVESASISTGLPMFDSLSVRSFRLEGEPKDKPARETDIKDVSEDYFRTAGTPVLRGRGFTRSEAMDVRSGVAIVNETFARMNFPQGDAIGHAIEFGSNEKPDRKLIVAAVPDSHEMGLEEAARPEVFLPTRDIGAMAVMLRTKGDPLAFSNALTAAVWAIDKDQTASDIKTLAAHFHLTTEQRRFDTLLFGGLAGLALLLAAVGLYGVLSYTVMLRTREIGLRVALGAQSGDVLRLIVKNGLALTLTGVAIGGAGALALTRFMEGLVFGVNPSDPLTFAAVALALTAVSLVACYVPARRAAAVDPVESLRAE
jgi:putative ABC transport system permease protein